MSNFPETVAPDVLQAVGLDLREVLGGSDLLAWQGGAVAGCKRDPGWRLSVLEAWDRQCAFCGYHGQFAGSSVGIEAAHVRWFAFSGRIPSITARPCARCTTSCSTWECSDWTPG